MGDVIEDAAARISELLPGIKRGTLRFWGEWFGRPYDGCQQLVACSRDGDCLLLEFDQGEKLRVWAPSGLETSADAFSIRSASKVRWEWHHYGRPKSPETLCFQEYVDDGSGEKAVELL